MKQPAHRELITEHGMRGLLIEPTLIGFDQRAPSLGREIAAAGAIDEIAGRHLAIVERGENGGIGEQRTERLEKIERQGGAARALDVIKALPRIEADGGQRGRTLRVKSA
jgi:hypothetical protein